MISLMESYVDSLDFDVDLQESEQAKALACDVAKGNIEYYRGALFDIKKYIKECDKITDKRMKFECKNKINDVVQQLSSEVDNQLDIISKNCKSHRILRFFGRELVKLAKWIAKKL